VTPADTLAERTYEPFCANGVLATIYALADFSHSKAMADLITAGKWKGELLLTLGKVAPPRYANFIGRYKDDPAASVRQAVAAALGLIDNEKVTLPVLTQLLVKADTKEDFSVRWEASSSLSTIAGRKGSDSTRRRLIEFLQNPDRMTVLLAARAVGLAGEARGLAKLRELATHADSTVSQEAVLALGEAADKGSREVLIRRLEDDSLAVRENAIYALGRTGDPSVIPLLRKAVEDYEGKHGQGFGLRETLQEAIEAAQRPRGG
jgi:HEAT repeat protein